MKTTFHQIAFEWDDQNIHKNWEKHMVKYTESEEVFLNNPVIVEIDKSKILYHEDRKIAYGVTDDDRLVFIAFTTRNNKIRVISSRDMSRKERKFYEETKKAAGL
ncbi:MAG: BrnT family toxin [Elusimicrobiota bacterium]|nr:BrnT family toxin [Elusimicrobiota bacterium]